MTHIGQWCSVLEDSERYSGYEQQRVSHLAVTDTYWAGGGGRHIQACRGTLPTHGALCRLSCSQLHTAHCTLHSTNCTLYTSDLTVQYSVPCGVGAPRGAAVTPRLPYCTYRSHGVRPAYSELCSTVQCSTWRAVKYLESGAVQRHAVPCVRGEEPCSAIHLFPPQVPSPEAGRPPSPMLSTSRASLTSSHLPDQGLFDLLTRCSPPPALPHQAAQVTVCPAGRPALPDAWRSCSLAALQAEAGGHPPHLPATPHGLLAA